MHRVSCPGVGGAGSGGHVLAKLAEKIKEVELKAALTAKILTELGPVVTEVGHCLRKRLID